MYGCEFVKAWTGKCKQPANEAGRCAEHSAKMCCVCGKPATHECDETGQFVCGAPLCDDCEHTIFEDGTNGGIGFNAKKPPDGMQAHCKKTDQQFQPWYMRDETSNIQGSRRPLAGRPVSGW